MSENQDKITSFICEELQKVLSPDMALSAETDMTNDITVDSVAVMDLVFALEEEFDVAIPLNSLADIRKIGELADLVKGLQK